MGHYKCEGLDRIQKIEKLAKMGFKYLNGVRVTHEASDQEVKDMKQAVADNGVVPVQCGSGLKLWGTFDPSEADQQLDACKSWLDKNVEVGNTQFCLLPPKWNEDLPLEVSWGTSIEYTRKYAELCQERGAAVSCEIEPERDFITCQFKDAVAWIEHVDMPNFFMNIDTGHFTLWKFKARWLRKYAEMVVQMHLTDNDGKKHQSWALGDGNTDNVGYVRALQEGGWEENAKKRGQPPVGIIEYHIPGHDKPDFDDEVRRSLDWLKEHLPDLTLS